MDNYRRASSACFLFMFIVLSLHILSVFGDGSQQPPGDQNIEEKPSIARMVADTIAMLKSSHANSWEKIKTVIHDLQLKFAPPNLDFRGADDWGKRAENGGIGAGEKLKQAAERSFGASKATAEESAKSAANAVGEAMHKTTEKVKDKLSNGEDSKEDL